MFRVVCVACTDVWWPRSAICYYCNMFIILYLLLKFKKKILIIFFNLIFYQIFKFIFLFIYVLYF